MKPAIIGCVMFFFTFSALAGKFLESFDDGELEGLAGTYPA